MDQRSDDAGTPSGSTDVGSSGATGKLRAAPERVGDGAQGSRTQGRGRADPRQLLPCDDPQSRILRRGAELSGSPASSTIPCCRRCWCARSSKQALGEDPTILEAAEADVRASFARDPACDDVSTPFLFHKGFHALQAYRIAHWLWMP